MALAPRLASPTAMQNRAVAHETAARVRVCGTGIGLGTRSACHTRPFQRAATGPVLPRAWPVAWHRPGTAQDTSSSWLRWPWLGVGMDSHARPFHRMAWVSDGPVAP